MEKTIAEELKDKYLKTDFITDLKDLLYQSARKYKNNIAFKLKNEKGEIYGVTYEEFKNDVESFGTGLINKGLKGKAIAVIGKNSYSWAVAYLAATIVGIVVPIDKELQYGDILNFLNASESGALIGDTSYLKMILDKQEEINNKSMLYIEMNSKKEMKNVLNYETLKKEGKELLKQNNTEFKDIKINPDELKILLFTSGTTGNAKGVCLSHKNITSNILSVCGIVKVKESDHVLSILPIHHTFECTLGYLLVIYRGATISYCEGLRYITTNIQEFKPTIILCVPLLLENVHKKLKKTIEKLLAKLKRPTTDCSIKNLPFFLKPIVKIGIKKSLGGKMRMFIVGAASLNPNIVADFNDLGVPAIQGYGLTECSPLVAGNNDFYRKDDAVGLPIPNVEYKINNPDEKGIGEIIVKGENVMIGYYRDPEETAKAIKDGWFYTGDLGKIDKDKYLYITGRCKTVIVTKNGKNIYPEEIEYYLNENPLVQEAIIMGVNHKNDDETYVNAQIYPNLEGFKEVFRKEEFSKEEIKVALDNLVAEINKKLPNYKHIKKLHIRDTEFEKTTTQKIKRFGDNLKI